MVEVGGTLLYWLVFSFPLGIIGIYWILSSLVAPKFYNARGHVRVSYLKPNNRWKHFWAKPEQETTKEGAHAYFFKHKKEVFPFVDREGTTTLEGTTMRAFYDTEGNQLNIKTMEKYMPQVAPRMLDSMMKRIWNAARASAFVDQKRILLLLVMVMLVAGGAVVMGVINYQNSLNMMAADRQILSMINQTQSMISQPPVTGGLTPVAP